MSDTPKPAPAQPAATQMAARLTVIAKLCAEDVNSISFNRNRVLGDTRGNWAHVMSTEEMTEVIARRLNDELNVAVAKMSPAPQKLPAAAQPQRESEQPEQALRRPQYTWTQIEEDILRKFEGNAFAAHKALGLMNYGRSLDAVYARMRRLRIKSSPTRGEHGRVWLSCEGCSKEVRSDFSGKPPANWSQFGFSRFRGHSKDIGNWCPECTAQQRAALSPQTDSQEPR